VFSVFKRVFIPLNKKKKKKQQKAKGKIKPPKRNEKAGVAHV